MKTYFIQEYLLDKPLHGSIGNVDIERVLLKNNAEPIFFPCHFDFSLRAKLKRLAYLMKTIRTLPDGCTVFFQYPFYAKMTKALLWLLQFRKKIRVVCILADINGLKHGKPGLLQREKVFFNRYRYFIVHNEAMQRWLDSVVPGNRAAQLEFFDFLTSIPGRKPVYEPVIVFAGNLEKSPFLEQLHRVTEKSPQLVFHIYGQPVSPAIHFSDNIVYKGVFEPYEMPQKLEGAFGLVWDGVDISTAGGSMGLYMHYITHHKVSLYIMCGIPLIAYEECGSAPLIRKYQIGITVSSLFEIEEKIRSLPEDGYRQMCANTRELARKIAEGGCTTQAYREISGMILGEENTGG